MPNNKKILPDATQFDYMNTAFMRQQINGQISPNPTYNNAPVSVPSFTRMAMITDIVEPTEEVFTRGMRFVEYKAEEVAQYFSEVDGDMSWKKIVDLTDNFLGPNLGYVWDGNTLSEPFSNVFDNLIGLQNTKYQVGDIVQVMIQDRSYQPVEVDGNTVNSKDLGIGINNWAGRWFITGGLGKDGSATWEYAISADRTEVEFIVGSGAINYHTRAFNDGWQCANCTNNDGLKIFKSGEMIQFSVGSILGPNPSFTADATEGTISFYALFSVVNQQTLNGATQSEAGFSSLSPDDFFTFDPPWGAAVLHGSRIITQGWSQYLENAGDPQETSPVTGNAYKPLDYDKWIQVPLCTYKAHESVTTPGKFLIYDISPILKETLDIEDPWTWVNDPSALGPSSYVGDCGIDIVEAGSGTTTTLTFSIDNIDLSGAGLVAGTDCLIDVGAGCGITVNADDIEVDNTALAGAGLAAGTGCLIDVGAGCAITVNANDVAVDVSALAGAGLIESTGGGCQPLDVGAGTYITVNADDITIDVVALAAFMAGDCIDDDGAGKLDLAIVAGAGMTQTGCTLNVTATGGTTYTEGCGIDISVGDVISIDLNSASGLKFDGVGNACDLLLDLGCGLEFNGNAVQIDTSALAGDGLKAGLSACELDINPGCGIQLITTGTSTDLLVAVDVAGFVESLGATGLNYDLDVDDCGTMRLDVMTLATATPVVADDYIAFGTTIDVMNEKALFTDFIKKISPSTYDDTNNTQVLGHINGVLQWFDKKTSC